MKQQDGLPPLYTRLYFPRLGHTGIVSGYQKDEYGDIVAYYLEADYGTPLLIEAEQHGCDCFAVTLH